MQSKFDLNLDSSKLNIMKNKLLSSVFLLSTVFFTTNIFAWKVLSRKVSDCSSSERCSNTSKVLCQYQLANGNYVKGYCIDCSGHGTSPCPTSAVGFPSGHNLDATDISQAQDGIDYALAQIANGTLTGSHQVNVTVNGVYRTYTCTWSSDSSGENSTIEVDRVPD